MYGKLCKGPPEVIDDTMKGKGKIVMKKPTKVNLGSTKSSEVPGAAYGKLRKSSPKVEDDTMKGEGKIVMKTPRKETDETMKVEGDETIIVDASTELRTSQENSDVADDNFFLILTKKLLIHQWMDWNLSPVEYRHLCQV
jgi:hypothetical protein